MISAFLKRPWWQQVLAVAMLSICYIQFAAMIGTKVLVPKIGWSDGIRALDNNKQLADSFPGRLSRWDTGYYLQIAEDGYQANGTERAFFPLYPMLIRSVSFVSGLPLVWSGTLVSIFCFILACLLFYRCVLVDYPEEVAMKTVIWVCCFPLAFFFLAIYTEALFLLLCIACFYFARRGQFIAGGIAIALAGATRLPAFLLAIPYFVEFWQQRVFTRTQYIEIFFGTLIAPLGVAGYFLFLALIAHSTDIIDIYLSNQSAEWNRSITWPWISLYDGVSAALLGKNINLDWFSRAVVWHDLAYALLGISSAIWGLFRIRLSAALFLLASMLFFYANHGPSGYAFWSIPRYIAAVFPIYLLFALKTSQFPRYVQWAFFLLSTTLLGILTAWFASGRWVA